MALSVGQTLIDELETRIEEFHCKGATEEQIAANAKKASQAARNYRKTGESRGRGLMVNITWSNPCGE